MVWGQTQKSGCSKGLPGRGGSLAQLVDREGTTVDKNQQQAPSSTLSATLRGLQK